jgi:hypothetical protein
MKLTYITFLLSTIFSFCNNLDASEIKIKQVIYNDYIADWSMSKYNRNMTYNKLDEDGMPIDLVILFSLKDISFKFTLDDSTGLIFKNRLIGSDTNWTFCDTNRISTFKIPKPGKFTYQVQGLRQNKVIKEKIFQFQISPRNAYTFTLDLVLLVVSFLLIYAIFKIK